MIWKVIIQIILGTVLLCMIFDFLKTRHKIKKARKKMEEELKKIFGE